MLKLLVIRISDKCDAPIEEEEQCSPEDTANARNICKKLNDDPIFEACRQVNNLIYLLIK